MQPNARYTILFTGLVCVVGSVFVASASVALRDRQEANKLRDRRRKVLDVAGLVPAGQRLSRDQVNARFDASIRPVIVNLQTGRAAPDVDPATFDQRAMAQNPATSTAAPANPAGVARLPADALVYHVIAADTVQSVILPIEGRGLWSTMYGFIALSADLRTITGLTFYEHGETPGLGGEVDNPSWKALWRGRRAFDDQWEPTITVIKGSAGPPDTDPYEVDGLSGATLTSRGVTNTLRFWLGDEGFGPYLRAYREERGIS
jgi:Na+-transporting NADH:ubiquinone oxidoreductase subunit C